MNLGHTHKTKFWYLLGLFSKFSDEHPCHFIGEYPPGTMPVDSKFKYHAIRGTYAKRSSAK